MSVAKYFSFLVFVFWVSNLFAQEIEQGLFVEKQWIAPKHIINAEHIESADFDKDGDLDILLTSNSADKIEWLENDGAGNFMNVHDVTLEAGDIEFINIADLDADGDLDVISVLEDEEFILWYANNGFGEFTPPDTICNDCNDITAIHMADLNDDGFTNVIIAHDKNPDLYWFKNQSDEGFQKISIDVGGYPIANIQEILTGDIDLDGDLDIVFRDYLGDYEIHTFKNEGFAETWTKFQNIDNGSPIKSLIDLDGDGYLDLLQKSIWRKNDGNGKFDVDVVTFLSIYEDFELIDMDKDEDMDLLWYGDSTRLYWMENIGQGVFEGINYSDISVGLGYHWENPYLMRVAQGDFDNDGFEDIVVGSDGRISWYPNNQLGGFEDEKKIAININVQTSLRKGDMDNDGDIDILIQDTYRLIYFKNQGNETFSQTPKIIYQNMEADFNNEFELADIDKDGLLDIIVYQGVSGLLSWFKQEENDFQQYEIDYTSPDGNTYESLDIAIADLDGNGYLDIISGTEEAIYWYANNGNSQFVVPPRLIIDDIDTKGTAFYNYEDNIEIVDINKDGKLDILVLSNTIDWIEQDEQNNFTIRNEIEVPPIQTIAKILDNFEIKDFDNDGWLDIIYTYKSSDAFIGSGVSWLKNLGTGSFHYEELAPIDRTVVSFMVEDIDSDGDMDIVISENSEFAKIYENNGLNQLLEPQLISSQIPSIHAIELFDIDGDNDEDIFVSNYYYIDGGRLYLIENLMNDARILSTAFLDENENGIWEESEFLLKNQKLVLNPEAKAIFTDNNGQAFFYLSFGSHELTYEPQTLWELSTADSIYNIHFDENYIVQNYLFGFKPARILHRVYPNLTSAPTRCNEEIPFWLNYINTGTTIAEGTISLQADSLTHFISADPEPDYEEDGELVWEIKDFYPSDERKIKLFYKMPNVETIGDSIIMKASVELVNPENELVYSKETEYISEIRCSFDPNDKLAYTEEFGNQDFVWIEDSLYYTVRFQNTGNDFARNVRITDFLDKRLDWTTLSPLTSSHDVQTNFDRTTGEITFLFEDIMLPDSTTNEPESHGFVTYSIGLLENVENKVEINNTAFIYFDFNAPIITNTTAHLTTSNPTTSITNHKPLLYLNIYPNPTKDYWQVELKHPITQNYQLQLLDVTGKKLNTYTNLQNGTTTIEQKGLQSGIYFLQLQDEAGKILGMAKLLVE